ncbi:MAG TPA: 50S ribosomal protein L35 [Patescibacteria group bacterium]|nr:50S ribosomal protein L35 [Patescibacteria group bacterium]
MSKIKTRKAAAKRFKITASGKVLHRHQMRRHLRRKKSDANMRRKSIMTAATGAFAKRIKQMMAE